MTLKSLVHPLGAMFHPVWCGRQQKRCVGVADHCAVLAIFLKSNFGFDTSRPLQSHKAVAHLLPLCVCNNRPGLKFTSTFQLWS